MSNPVRYNPIHDPHLGADVQETKEGLLVLYSDYAALQAEVERLTRYQRDYANAAKSADHWKRTARILAKTPKELAEARKVARCSAGIMS